MIESWFSALSAAMSGRFEIALLAAYGWGVLSILLSPCHLSSIPLVIGYITSQGKISLRRSFSLSLVFSVGILITIAMVGGDHRCLWPFVGRCGHLGKYSCGCRLYSARSLFNGDYRYTVEYTAFQTQ